MTSTHPTRELGRGVWGGQYHPARLPVDDPIVGFVTLRNRMATGIYDWVAGKAFGSRVVVTGPR